MTDTSKAQAPGQAGETTEERQRRMAEHRIGPEDEARNVPERPPSGVPATPGAAISSQEDRHSAAPSPGARRRDCP